MTTITQERARLAAVGMTLRRREQWGARRSYTDARTVTEPATRVFVHITITNPSSYSGFDAHARAVENIGINRFPNTGISYNRLIFAGTDTVYEGQPIGRRGAHTVNDFKRSTCSTPGCPGRGSALTAPSWNLNYNARAYAICQNTQHAVTDQMVNAVARAIAADTLAGFVTKDAAHNIHGHRCVSAKSCPGDRMWARIDDVQTKVNYYINNGLVQEDDDVGYAAWTAADKKAFMEDVFKATWLSDKIPAPDGYDATANPNWAAQSIIRSAQFWAHLGTQEALPWESAGVAAYARDVVGWKNPDGTVKNVSLRYLVDVIFSIVHRMDMAQTTAFKAVNDTLAEILGASQDNNLSQEEWKALLDERLDAAFEENTVKVDISLAGLPSEAP